ncbi:hypothetical protein ABD89_11065 [Lysinibacillus sphaericus]|nr:hypothetical protein [Lysinibacillus sphaericus]
MKQVACLLQELMMDMPRFLYKLHFQKLYFIHIKWYNKWVTRIEVSWAVSIHSSPVFQVSRGEGGVANDNLRGNVLNDQF